MSWLEWVGLTSSLIGLLTPVIPIWKFFSSRPWFKELEDAIDSSNISVHNKPKLLRSIRAFRISATVSSFVVIIVLFCGIGWYVVVDERSRLSRWLASSDHQVFSESTDGLYDVVRAFKNRDSLIRESDLADTLNGAMSFDLIAFSAHVVKEFQSSFESAIRSGATVRIVLLDPGHETTVYYDAIAPELTETPEVKREEARQVVELIGNWRRLCASGAYQGSVELKWLRDVPLFYNMWIKNIEHPTRMAHVSVYFYGGRSATPSFRGGRFASDFVRAAHNEFQQVWLRAREKPSGSGH